MRPAMRDLHDNQTTPCPPWCEQIQCQEANPADRFHQRIEVVPVVHREVGGMAAADELAVVIFTSAAKADEVWIGLDLGEGVASITVSVESSKRVLGAVAAGTASVTDACQGIPPMAG